MKILVIDDDPAMTELTRLLLLKFTSDVIIANSGVKGIEFAKAYNPDIVLLDLMMPEMNGGDVCKCIREFSNVPILILSALDSPESIAKALDAGADDYIIKPVGSNVLIAHINKLIRRNNLLLNAFAT